MKTIPYFLIVLLTGGLLACGTKAEESREKKPVEQTDDTSIPVKLTKVESVVRSEPVVASGLVSVTATMPST